MSKTELPSSSSTRCDPLITINVSRRAGWLLWFALIVAAALAVLAIRSREPIQTANATTSAPSPTVTERVASQAAVPIARHECCRGG